MVEKPHYKKYLPFVPLLVLYMVLILIFSNDTLFGDEIRHMKYAMNLSAGFYTNAENPEFVNGPGYPLVITPLALLNIPYIVFKLLNAVFLILAVIYFFKGITRFVHPKIAIALSYVLGLYPPLLKWMVFIYSESFALFLMCGFFYFFMKAETQDSKRKLNVFVAALFLGFLALTKVIFGYVILTVIIFSLVALLIKRTTQLQTATLVFVIAFLFCTPYLSYTYSLTGKAMYWGTQGGEILYWRTTPYPNEYGDWINPEVALGQRNDDYYATTEIAKNHGAFFRDLESYSIVERDELLKEKAIENIKQYPIKYLQNTAATGLRLFFNYPFSYTPQKITSYYYILPNGVLLICLLSALFLFLKRPARIPFEVRYLAFMALIFLGGLVLLNGRVRHMIPAIPILLFFIIFVFKQVLEVKLKAATQQ